MQRHYTALGISYGCSEEDVRRAYRKKALLLHPDRNPQGGELFKALHISYEAVLTDVKNGGRGYSAVGAAFFHARAANSTAGSGGAAFSSPLSTSTSTSFSSTARRRSGVPLFSDAELFGNAVPGGWSTYRQSNTGHESSPSPGNGGQGGPATASHPGGTESKNTAVSEADRRWRQAHGHRVPVSGFTGDYAPPPPLFTGPLPAASYPSGSSGTTAGAAKSSPSGPAKDPLGSAKTSQKSQSSSSSSSGGGGGRGEGAQAPGGEKGRTFASSDGSATETAAAQRASDDATFLYRHLHAEAAAATRRAELQREWSKLEESIDSKLFSGHKSSKDGVAHGVAGGPSNGSTERASDLKQRIQAIYEEEVEAARRWQEARVDGARRQEQLEKKKQEEELERQRARNRQSQQHRDALQSERRLLVKEYLRYRYMPDPFDVGEMKDMEVYLLLELFDDTAKKLKGVMEGRFAKGKCSSCASLPRSSRLFFLCDHHGVCDDCITTQLCATCPLCGAALRGGTATAESRATPASPTENGSQVELNAAKKATAEATPSSSPEVATHDAE